MISDPVITDSTQRDTVRQLSVQLSTGASNLTDELKEVLEAANMAQQSLYVALALARFSDATGGHVKLAPEYCYVPVLIGSDGEPVPVFHLVEVIDGLVGYDEIQRQMPTLTYAQIDGAISFLRKVAQYNLREIDFDALEDDALRSDPVFLGELRESLADKETIRVLNRD